MENDVGGSAEEGAFGSMILEHTIAARTSRRLESGRFVALGDAVETMRLTGPDSTFCDEQAAFALLIQTMLNSASGQHADFNSRSSLQYILDALIFYANLQSTLQDPEKSWDNAFESQFAGWFVDENSSRQEFQ